MTETSALAPEQATLLSGEAMTETSALGPEKLVDLSIARGGAKEKEAFRSNPLPPSITPSPLTGISSYCGVMPNNCEVTIGTSALADVRESATILNRTPMKRHRRFRVVSAENV